MNVPDQLVEYARQIAVYRGYSNLENSLQPYSVLQAKLAHEKQEFAEAVAAKDIWHQYHEAADLLYYAACSDEHLRIEDNEPCIIQHDYYIALVNIKNANLDPQKAEKAALAKYDWRASGPNRKDEEYEIELIKQAIGE